jgi:hypothetical protein
MIVQTVLRSRSRVARVILLVTGAAFIMGCARTPTDNEIAEAVLMTAHASGAVVMQSVSADSTPFTGVVYDADEGTLTFDSFSTERFELPSAYATIDGTVVLGDVEIEHAEVELSGGAVQRIEFGYEDSAPLSGERTVSGRADGRRFRVTITTADVRAFRER